MLSTEQAFPLFDLWSTAYRGLALAKQGQPELGIAHLKQALFTLRVIGSELNLPLMLSFLADAYGCAGQADEGLGALAEAVTLIETTDQHMSESEICRLRGELLLILARPDEPQAESRFLRAIDIARRQEAKSFELRATTNLSRLWQRQGKRGEARRTPLRLTPPGPCASSPPGGACRLRIARLDVMFTYRYAMYIGRSV